MKNKASDKNAKQKNNWKEGRTIKEHWNHPVILKLVNVRGWGGEGSEAVPRIVSLWGQMGLFFNKSEDRGMGLENGDRIPVHNAPIAGIHHDPFFPLQFSHEMPTTHSYHITLLGASYQSILPAMIGALFGNDVELLAICVSCFAMVSQYGQMHIVCLEI